jgi:RNA polymerase sigma-70 factor (ECF subfamily)
MRTDRNAYVELLVLCAQDGDRQALSDLVDHWHLRLSRYALHMTGDVEASVEVMQEVWLAVVRSLRRLDDPARFGSWAYRIVGNKCNDWLRRRVRGRATVQPLHADPLAKDCAQGEPSDDIDRLREGLAQLDPAQRAVLSMFYLDEMSIQEIADACSVPLGTVKSRLFYARNHLKHILKREDQ